jgi:putative ABC transport system permease protein
MRLATIALRNLVRRPARSALTGLGVAIAVASLFALLSLARGVENAWRLSLDERGSHLVVYERGVVEILASSLPADLAASLADIPGIRAVAPELVSLAPVGDDAHALVTEWPLDSYLWRAMHLREGRLPRPGERGVVVLGETLAKALGRHPGEHVSLLYQEFEVIGIARFAGVMNNGVAFLPPPALQELLSRPGSTTLINIELVDPGDRRVIAAVRQRLAAVSPRAEVAETESLTRDNRVLGLLRAIGWATSAIALTMGLLAVVNTLMMAVAERTAEIGILSAIGWSRWRILAMILLEGMLLSVAGSVIGCVLGVVIAQWIAAMPAVRGFVEPEITLRLAAIVALALLALGGLGPLYPAWRAMRLDPERALQS